MIKGVAFDLFGTLLHGRELYPEVRNVLEKLKRDGYKIGLISNATSESRERLFEHGILDYFDSIVWAYDGEYPKPHSEPFEKSLEDLGLKMEEVLYIGDSEDFDAKGSEAVGMFAVHLKRAGESGFHRSVKSLDEVFQFLEN